MDFFLYRGLQPSWQALETVQKYPEGSVNRYGIDKVEVVTAAFLGWLVNLKSSVELLHSWQLYSKTPLDGKMLKPKHYLSISHNQPLHIRLTCTDMYETLK